MLYDALLGMGQLDKLRCYKFVLYKVSHVTVLVNHHITFTSNGIAQTDYKHFANIMKTVN